MELYRVGVVDLHGKYRIGVVDHHGKYRIGVVDLHGKYRIGVVDHHGNPANKEPFLNQLAGVILVHNWYHSISTCFHVYSREYTCSACCHEF